MEGQKKILLLITADEYRLIRDSLDVMAEDQLHRANTEDTTDIKAVHYGVMQKALALYDRLSLRSDHEGAVLAENL